LSISIADANSCCYATMAQATEDQQAKQMYERMTSEIDNHLQYLEGRLDYLNQNNKLNQQ
jgi:rubrerythrin